MLPVGPTAELSQSVLNFLDANATVRSTALMRDVLDALPKSGNFLLKFLVPVERNMLSHSGALLWLAFLHEAAPSTNAADYAQALDIIAAKYDLDHSEKIGVHLLESESDDDDD